MECVKVEGIILRDIAYGESSKILTLFTKEYGIIGAIAKGCRGVKSKLRGVSMPLTYGYFYINYRKNALSTLTQVDVLNPFTNLRTDITKISYASYLLELTEQVVKETLEEAVFDLIKNALIKINEGLDSETITMILEIQYLDYLGVALNTSSCAICGSTNHIKTISVEKGGFLCENCYKNEKIYSDKIIKLFRMFAVVDLSKVTKLEIQDAIKKEMHTFLEMYYDEYTGLYLKSRSFLKNLKRLEDEV